MLGLNDFCTNIFIKYKIGSVVKEEKKMVYSLAAYMMIWGFLEREVT